MDYYVGPPFFVFIPFIAFIGIFVVIVCVKVWIVFSHDGDWRDLCSGRPRRCRYPRRHIGIGFVPPPNPPSYYPPHPSDTASPVHYPLYSNSEPPAPQVEVLSAEALSQYHTGYANGMNQPPAYPPPPPYARYDQYPPLPALLNASVTTSHGSAAVKPADDFPPVE